MKNNVCIIFYLDTICSYLLSREMSVYDNSVQQVGLIQTNLFQTYINLVYSNSIHITKSDN